MRLGLARVVTCWVGRFELPLHATWLKHFFGQPPMSQQPWNHILVYNLLLAFASHGFHATWMLHV